MRSFASIAAVILYWLYAFLLLTMELSETCTMGGEGLLPHLITGGPLAVLSASLIFLVIQGQGPKIAKLLSVGTLPVVVALLVYHSVQALNVSILGHHSCGTEYDAHLDVVASFERWIPLVLLCLDIIVGWLLVRSLTKLNGT